MYSNWVGTVLGNMVMVTNTNKVTFVMQSNLVLQANIIPNPFIPLAGTITGWCMIWLMGSSRQRGVLLRDTNDDGHFERKVADGRAEQFIYRAV